jgi:hypothetical protein
MPDRAILIPIADRGTSETTMPVVVNTTPPPSASGNESDSTGSLPDLIPAGHSDNEADESGDDVHVHPTTLATNANTRRVNGTMEIGVRRIPLVSV